MRTNSLQHKPHCIKTEDLAQAAQAGIARALAARHQLSELSAEQAAQVSGGAATPLVVSTDPSAPTLPPIHGVVIKPPVVLPPIHGVVIKPPVHGVVLKPPVTTCPAPETL